MQRLSSLASKARRTLNLEIRKWVDNRLISASSRNDGKLQSFQIESLHRLRQVNDLLLGGQRFEIYQLDGASALGELPVRLMFASENLITAEKTAGYFGTLLFDPETVLIGKVGQQPAHRIREKMTELAEECRPDLAVIERNRLRRWKPEHGEWMLGPVWTRMIINFQPGEDWEAIHARMNRQRQNIRRMRRSQLSLAIANSDKDFEFFYHRMHVPMVKERHTTYARINNYENLYGYFKRGMLVFAVTPEQERVAGALMFRSGNTVFGVCNGVLDGNLEWMNQGAVAALYYLTIQWCHENGVSSYDIGESHPLVGDGLFQHKRRWGFEPGINYWDVHDWLFWVPSDSTFGLNWLAKNGFWPQFCTSSPGLASQRHSIQEEWVREKAEA